MRALLFSLLLAIAPPALAQTASPAAEIMATLKDAQNTRVLVAAHRGAHAVSPENSIDAIEGAIAMGVDIIEIDVRLTRDGVPVLMHDAKVDRTTTGSGAVRDMTFDQFAALELVDAKGAPTDLHPPTLMQALAAAKDRALLDLDLKADAVEPVISRVIEAGMIDQVLFFNDGTDHLKKFVAIQPHALPMPRAHSLETTREVSSALTPEVIHIDPGFNTRDTHAAAMQSDSRMWINALGAPDQLIAEGKPSEGVDPLLANGASILQTDRPAELIAYLERIGRR
ncbi:MAG: glycerophosphodiester phosphodiesterase family protein [Hyphomonadaceae bacterium]